jgi:hypothetical protein
MVANSLSCNGNWSDEELTQMFCTHCPSQIPPYFEIQPLPSKITSWLTVLLLKLPVKAQLNKKHTRTSLGHGTDGQSTADGLYPRIPSLTTPRPSRIKFVGAFAVAMRKARFSGPSYDQLAHSSVTSAISHVCQTFREHGRPNPTTTESLDFFYNWSSDHSRKPTPPKSTRKQSQCQSSPPWQNNNFQNLTAPLSN